MPLSKTRQRALRGLVAAVVLVCSTTLVLPALVASRQVYTVREVLAGLSRHPGAWAGRTVLVWGSALELVPGCPRGQWCPRGLYTPYTRRPGPLLLLEPGAPSTPLTGLRQFPLLRTVLPQPQYLHWQTPALYRLVLAVVPHTTCHAGPCINVVLPDAAI